MGSWVSTPPSRSPGRQVTGRALILAAAAVTTIAVLAVVRSQAPTGAPATLPTPSTTPPSLSSALVLPTTTMTAGGEIHGRVVVQNRTGHDLNLTGCGGIFAVLLTSSTYRPRAAWPLCLQHITIPAGQSSYPVTVLASYSACSMLGPSPDMPACLPTGSPPLPPGDYQATTFESTTAVPLPPAIRVHVTA